ncbi:MAG: sulfur oxidation c-type cytochrome SoxA [Pseudomonadota bacterium]
MVSTLRLAAASLAALTLSAAAWAQATGPDNDTLIVNGEIEMVTHAPAPEHMNRVGKTIYSGWRFRTDQTQAIQMDDFDNPAFIFVDAALETWNTVEGAAGNSCATCHEQPAASMAGVRAVYPKWNEDAGEVRTLGMQINACRTENMQAEPYKIDSRPMSAMEALISVYSRGMPVDVAIDGAAASTWEKGRELYYTRFGQLQLACANCHEDNYGNMIRADHLSQGQINGFPVYRLKNTRLNTAQGRFKGCIRDTRAETFQPGSPELVALELYVASRGNGLSVEAPSVRN